MAFLYSPPTYPVGHRVRGTRSMWHRDVWSTSVWRLGGVWHQATTPAYEDYAGADFFFNTPTIIPPELVGELTAFGIGTITTV